MIFKRILINNFGGLREKDIELTSGVNVLYGLKETEMNIVFIFVKSMFFGVPEEMQEKRHNRVVEMRLCFFSSRDGDYKVLFVSTRKCRSTYNERHALKLC